MKLCKDCKLRTEVREPCGYYGEARWVSVCGRTGSTDPVNGDRVGMTYCRSERKSLLPWRCGPKARHHTPKSPQ